MLTTLDKVEEGKVVTVKGVNGEAWTRRLYQMGVLPGSRVKVVFNRGRGPLVIQVGEAEISIGRSIAKNIVVEID
ncbi:MAG: FeoA family protein [Desulfurococcaceae archaeon]